MQRACLAPRLRLLLLILAPLSSSFPFRFLPAYFSYCVFLSFLSFFLSFLFSREYRGKGGREKKHPGAGFLFVRRRKLEEGSCSRGTGRERGREKSSTGMIRVNKDKSNSGGTGEKREIKCSLTSDSQKRRFLFFNGRGGETRAATHPCGNESRETAVEYPRILNFIKEPLFFDSSPRFGALALSLSLLVLFLYFS